MTEASQPTETSPAAKKPRERQYASQERGVRRPLQGIVVSNKMQKTCVIEVERVERHAKYKKYIRRHSKVYVHDEKGEAKVGDTIEVIECRPMSKLKRFYLAKIVKKAGS